MKIIKEEFKSIHQFEEYINNTPLNECFRWEQLASSKKGEVEFYGTSSYQESLELLRHGWDTMAKSLEQKLSLIKNEIQAKHVMRSHYDVAGFQASVPRYLQGIPTSMINQRKVEQKQKVITIVKHIGYLSNVSAAQIMENSIKALQIVKRVEALGYRVNLDVISPAVSMGHREAIICRVRVKSASERLNISKVAFPLVNPGFFRRLVWRFREVHPDVKDFQGWRGTYGITIGDRNRVRQFLNEGEYYLHNFISNVDAEIAQMGLK